MVTDVRAAGPYARRTRVCKPDDGVERCPVRWITYERRGRVVFLDSDEENIQPVVSLPEKTA